MTDIERLCERYGFPEPIDTTPAPLPGRPLVAAQIDLGETYERKTCCCALHGSLHDRRTCCPEHRQTRAGLPIPTMTPDVTSA